MDESRHLIRLSEDDVYTNVQLEQMSVAHCVDELFIMSIREYVNGVIPIRRFPIRRGRPHQA